jgi:hypothetical protein
MEEEHFASSKVNVFREERPLRMLWWRMSRRRLVEVEILVMV